IEVQRHGDPSRFTASVIAISHDADLALLQVEEDTFFNNTTPLKLGSLPDLLDEVFVYGFPEGGEGLSVTKGIISRIEITPYVHSFLSLLGLQIDAAINSGNSGGPVIMNGKIVGVAMQTKKKAENIGYIIPVPIIIHFLTDIKDGHYDGFPDYGVVFQSLRNPAFKKLLNLPDSATGVYVSFVIPGTSSDGLLFPGDVILSVDEHSVASDGTVLVRPGLRVQFDYYIVNHQMGESAIVTVWRQGRRQKISIPLTMRLGGSQLVKFPQYDCPPEYYILSGIILTPLSYYYLLTWDDEIKEAPKNLLEYFYKFREKAGEQVVIISGLLPSEMTAGYENAVDERIISINGQSFTNFKSFTEIIDKALTKDKLITLKMENHSVIVVSPQEHRKNEKKLLELYGIDKPCRVK
ncbi:MAG: trypsin-like peptidase domain-containing protein, partial [Deltaproteobacteria bacterium]|nr:trypsin-like peptidase domain-containing protein [Deltaproteobacteria bacterium]